MFISAVRRARPFLSFQHKGRLLIAPDGLDVSRRNLNTPDTCFFCSEVSPHYEKRSTFVSKRQLSSSRTIAEDSKLDLFVSCLPGLEHILSDELNALGIRHSRTISGANVRDASVEQLFQCHLYLGTASHVLIRCGKPFRARSFAELRRKVAKTSWSKWLMDDVYITDIRVSASKSKLYHTDAISERIQKAIDASLGRDAQDPNNEEIDAGKAVQLTVRIVRDVVQISIDTSESPLHQRGYRLETAKAPLREDIAFALLYSSGWKPQYVHEGGEHQDLQYGGLLDPFCGSGTILIEAASILAGLPPGRFRPVPLGGTHLFDPVRWKSSTEDRITRPLEPQFDVVIFGSDRDDGAVAAAASNADRAGVGDFIDVCKAAVACNPWLENPSLAPAAPLIITNPPFGKRIKGKGVSDTLLPLYQTLGNRVARMSEVKHGTTATVLAHDVNLARRMGFPVKTLFSTHHGGIEVSAMSTASTNEEDRASFASQGGRTPQKEMSDK